MYEWKETTFDTLWGIPVTVVHREGTTDLMTMASIMIHDEYSTTKFRYDPGDTFIDLGSHVGSWAMLMAIRDPSFKVYAYEAVQENYDIILKNIELNNLANTKAFLGAVSSDSEGSEPIFYTNDDTDFGKSHKFVASMLGGPGKRIEVPKIGLNEIFEENNIENCKVLKADCEGCEVLGFSTLKEEHLKKIEYVVGEFHQWKMDFDTFFGLFEPYFDNIGPHQAWGNFVFRRKRQ